MTLPRKKVLTGVILSLLLVLVLIIAAFIPTEVPTRSNAVAENASTTDDKLDHTSKTAELELIERELSDLGAKQAYASFKERNARQEIGVQHEYAHLFGQALYESIGVPGVAICDATFAFGCFHSFFGRALMENGPEIITELEKACIDAFGIKGLGCQHGIGHGVLADLGRDNLMDALEICGSLQWKGPIGGCTSGVYMEYNFNTINNADPRPLIEGETHKPCAEVPDRFKQACYFELPQWWSAMYRREFEHTEQDDFEVYARVSQNCSEVHYEEQRIACYQGMGNSVAGAMTRSTDEIKNYCGVAKDPAGAARCLEGAAWLLSWEPAYESTWRELCSELPERDKTTCLSSSDMI